MRIKLVAEKPKAQRQGCTHCPVAQRDTQADKPKLVTIGLTMDALRLDKAKP